MKRFLLLLIGVAAVVAFVALPASAADLKFGGYFHTKFESTDNTKDGDDDADDNLNGFWTRMRLYFTAVASENVMAVAKFEIDDNWGGARLGSVSADGGSRDESGMEIKNAYLQFNVPNAPLMFQVGVLPINLGYGLAFNDDTSGIVAVGKFDPVKVTLAYSRLNDNSAPDWDGVNSLTTGANAVVGGGLSGVTNETVYTSSDDWDLWAAHIGFAPAKEFSLGLALTWLTTDYKDQTIDPGPPPLVADKVEIDHYNAVLDADFKTDVFSVYFTGGMNFGQLEAGGEDVDFKGFLLSGGGAFGVNMFKIGIDGYYASGDEIDDDDSEINDYVTPGRDGRPTNYMGEIVFPGMFFDDTGPTYANWRGEAVNSTNVRATGLTRTQANYTPVNIWAVGAHVDFKPLEQTWISVGAAYMQFVEDVVTEVKSDGSTDEDNTLGTEAYIRLSQGIVDGVTLKTSFGYLFADDGYTPNSNDDDAYKFGIGLFWSW